jgi:hypothetical protein
MLFRMRRLRVRRSIGGVCCELRALAGPGRDACLERSSSNG